MFSVLKDRFRIIKTPCTFHTWCLDTISSKEDIDNIFFTCVGLHNMLHAWNGRNEWECGVKWGGNDGAFDEAGEHWGLPKRK